MSEFDAGTEQEVAGAVRLDPDGKFDLPPEYQSGNVVIRTPWDTKVIQGSALRYFNSKNDVPEGYVQLKKFGEEPEMYRVEEVDDAE